MVFRGLLCFIYGYAMLTQPTLGCFIRVNDPIARFIIRLQHSTVRISTEANVYAPKQCNNINCDIVRVNY